MRKIKPRGSALISALFIMTLVAIAATAMSTRLQLDIYRTRLTILTDKLYFASQAVTFWAMGELSHKKNFYQATAQGKLMDFPPQFTTTIYPPFQVNGGLYDLQSRFNLNNLKVKAYSLFFFRLLNDPGLKLSNTERKRLVEDATQWISNYQPGRGNDNLMTYYLKQNPAYLPAHQAFQSPSELRLIRDVNASIYQALADVITVLPEQTPLNINTAPFALIKALGNGLTDEQVSQIINARQKGLKNLDKIMPLLQKIGVNSQQITLESQYFMSIAVVADQELSLINYTILKRQKDKQGKISVSLISESLNTL